MVVNHGEMVWGGNGGGRRALKRNKVIYKSDQNVNLTKYK